MTSQAEMYIKLSRPILVVLVTSIITLISGQSTHQELICWRHGQYNLTCNLTCSDGLARPLGCEICECRESMCTKPNAITCDVGWHCEVHKTGHSWFLTDVTVCVEDKPGKSTIEKDEVGIETTQKVINSTRNSATITDTQKALSTIHTPTTIPETSDTAEKLTSTVTTSSSIATKPVTNGASTTSEKTSPIATPTNTKSTLHIISSTTITTTGTEQTITLHASTSSATAKSMTTEKYSSVSPVVTKSPMTSGTSFTPTTLTLGNNTESETIICEQKGRCDDYGNCLDVDYVCRQDGRCCKRDSSRPNVDSDRPRCQQRPDFGYCRSPKNRYVFDISRSKCVPTIFGGCGYSLNNFDSKEACVDSCERRFLQPSTNLAGISFLAAMRHEKPCMMPLSDGPCRANIPRYYYYGTERKCILFDYGGCQGNENSFRTAETCEIQCRMLSSDDAGLDAQTSRIVPNSHIIFPNKISTATGSNNSDIFNFNKADKVTDNNSDDNIDVTQSAKQENAESTTEIIQNIVSTRNNPRVIDRPNMLLFKSKSTKRNSGKTLK